MKGTDRAKAAPMTGWGNKGKFNVEDRPEADDTDETPAEPVAKKAAKRPAKKAAAKKASTKKAGK